MSSMRALSIIILLQKSVQRILLGRPHPLGKITKFNSMIYDSECGGEGMDFIVDVSVRHEGCKEYIEMMYMPEYISGSSGIGKLNAYQTVAVSSAIDNEFSNLSVPFTGNNIENRIVTIESTGTGKTNKLIKSITASLSVPDVARNL